MHMFRAKKTTAAKRIWRISESTPMGEWVNKAAPLAPNPSKDLPEVSHGHWVRSSCDLLDGPDVTEDPDTVPDDLFDELFPASQNVLKNTGK
jgi:hypothetical protein